MAVHIERAHAADAFAAVVVKDDGLLAVLYQTLVEDVECLEERCVRGGLDIGIIRPGPEDWPDATPSG